jgi:hypothetical protein
MFVVSQLIAGALNYLFQVEAARSLSEVDFGAWSHWLAQFSVACFAGIWIQSLSVLSELEKYFDLKKSRALLGVLLILILLAMKQEWEFAVSAFGWMFSLLNGFWFGVNLRAKNLRLLSMYAVIAAGSRFLWVLFDKSFYHAVVMAGFFGCLAFLTFSKSSLASDRTKPPLHLQLGLSALCLAFFSAWVPQMDLMVAPKLLTPENLGVLAKVTLLSKAFYFGFQTLAQVLLAHQVQPDGQRLQRMHFLWLGGLGVLCSFVGMFVARYFAWPMPWALLSLLHMTTLCLLFLAVQDFSARHLGKKAFSISLVTLMVAGIGTAMPALEAYWYLALVIEFAAIVLIMMKEVR